MLRRQATTIWLKARAEDHWSRVFGLGDRRPIDTHPRAREALRDLLARREPLYARADLTIDTSGLTVPQAAEKVGKAVQNSA